MDRSDALATVVVFAHPDCPCTQATLANLDRLRAEYPDAMALHVVFFDTTQRHDEWAHTRLKAMAARIPSARVVLDPDGREANLFGAQTSGHVVVFAKDGSAVFSGGVTPSRGHEGASPGLDAIKSLLENATPPTPLTQATVYGCPLGCSMTNHDSSETPEEPSR